MKPISQTGMPMLNPNESDLSCSPANDSPSASVVPYPLLLWYLYTYFDILAQKHEQETINKSIPNEKEMPSAIKDSIRAQDKTSRLSVKRMRYNLQKKNTLMTINA